MGCERANFLLIDVIAKILKLELVTHTVISALGCTFVLLATFYVTNVYLLLVSFVALKNTKVRTDVTLFYSTRQHHNL